MTWTPLTIDEAAAQWDAQLLGFADQNVYQSFGWGHYKRGRGWRPEYFRATAGDGVVSIAQVLVRRYPLGAVVAWCPGGPVSALEACSLDSMRQLASLLQARVLYCRATLLRSRTPDDERYLQANGWRRPARPISATRTVVWDLDQTEEQLLAGLNPKWRYSLRQAHKAALRIEQLAAPPIDELTGLCQAMNVSKGVPATIRRADVAGLFEALRDRAIVYGCRNASGELTAFRSAVVQEDRAWELIAATSPEGRRTKASFAVLWAFVLHFRRLGVRHYDLAGIDPVHAPGVADFKQCTGARDVEWLGEWEWSTSSVLRRAVHLVVKNRTEAGVP